MFACSRQRERLSREPCAGGSDRIQCVVLAAQSSFTAGLTTNLDHCFAVLAEIAGQAGTVMSGALDGPGTSAVRVLVCEAARRGVTVSARRHDRLRTHRTRARSDDRERVLITMGVDSDHLVQLVCEHPTDPRS
jgi:hypothetical protein